MRAVRASWLAQFLQEHDLELVAATLQERRVIRSNPRASDPWEVVYRSAGIDVSLTVAVGPELRERLDRQDDHPGRTRG